MTGFGRSIKGNKLQDNIGWWVKRNDSPNMELCGYGKKNVAGVYSSGIYENNNYVCDANRFRELYEKKQGIDFT